jgi:hypothetical protein
MERTISHPKINASGSRMKQIALAAVMLLALTPAMHAGQVVYGVSGSGGLNPNSIYAVNFSTFTESMIFSTDLNTTLNAVAWDASHKYLYYRTDASDSPLYRWNSATNTQVTVTGSMPVDGHSNASFYNGAYWYVEDQTGTLVAVTLNVANPNAPAISAIKTFNHFDGSSSMTYTFGDVAVSKSGVLFGSTGVGWFHVDISGANPNNFGINLMNTFGLQIAFDSTGSFIYAQDFHTGLWYTITDLASGAYIPLMNPNTNAQFQTTPLRDLANSSFEDSSTPEPASWQLLILGAVLIAPAVRRKFVKR